MLLAVGLLWQMGYVGLIPDDLSDSPAAGLQDNTVPSAGPAPKGSAKYANIEVVRMPQPGAFPYSIKLGYYRTREAAQAAMSRFSRKGLSPFWVKVNLGEQGIWHRIFYGHFKNREQAEEVIKTKKLTGNTAVKRTRYATFIGSYMSEETLGKSMLDLIDRNVCPYVIRDASGVAYVYVGAFYTRKGAEEQSAELLAGGISSRVVER
jgi:cell division protein FtsN